MVAYVVIFVCVTALPPAFVGQWLSPTRRTKTIIVAAAIPAMLLSVAMVVYAVTVGLDRTWFQAVVTVAFVFIAFMFGGLIPAIIGTELASLMGWISRRYAGQDAS